MLKQHSISLVCVLCYSTQYPHILAQHERLGALDTGSMLQERGLVAVVKMQRAVAVVVHAWQRNAGQTSHSLVATYLSARCGFQEGRNLACTVGL